MKIPQSNLPTVQGFYFVRTSESAMWQLLLEVIGIAPFMGVATIHALFKESDTTILENLTDLYWSEVIELKAIQDDVHVGFKITKDTKDTIIFHLGNDETKVNDIVAEAEDFFKAKIIEHLDNVPDDDVEVALENGFIDNEDLGIAICLSWSQVLINNPLYRVRCGETICTVGELRSAMADCDDNDSMILAPCDEEGDETDHYPFYVDIYDGLKDDKGNEFKEVRLCQQNHEAWDAKKSYDAILTPVVDFPPFQKCKQVVVRPDILKREEGVPVGDKYYYASEPLLSRWLHEDEPNETFQVYFADKWRDAESIDWNDYVK